MSDQHTPKDRINILKKRARKLSKNLSIPQSDALTLIAIEEGYDSWFTCNSAVKNGASITQQPALQNKIPSSTTLRLTHLDYSDDYFKSTNSLRNRLEREIKESLQRAKGAKLFVKLYLSMPQIQALDDPDSFFDSVLNRFENLQRLELHEADPSESPLLDLLVPGPLQNKGE